jgi:molybdopterin-guanine dinucleotide biosynthesis protein A
MKRDKAALEYAPGESQLDRAVRTLGTVVDRVFVSVRADQLDDPVRRRHEPIVDQLEGVGPIAGICAAQATHPHAAWWVLACDLPFVDTQTLAHLQRHREPRAIATAYRSAHDGLPEPLCAIYEPASRELLAKYVAAGRQCPRKFLIESDARLVDPPSAQALDNVNSADDYWRAMATIQPDTVAAPRTVRVQYFALLREQAGRSEEQVVTLAHTPRELYEELRAKHPFTLHPEFLRVAVNSEFGEWSQPLASGDVVVFIPPVAGG